MYLQLILNYINLLFMPFFRKVRQQDDVVIKDVNLIPMTSERILEDQSVYISGGKIRAIGKFNKLSFSPETTLIEGSGSYLVPGFSDMHVHLWSKEDFPLYLANGVTRIRNMWGMAGHLGCQRAIRERRAIGPDLITTGPLIDGPGSLWPQSFMLKNKKKVEKAIRKMQKAGYDAIKIYDKLGREIFYEIMRVAREVDIPVVGHIPHCLGAKEAICEDVLSIEHFMGYDVENGKEKLKEEAAFTVRHGTWNCPTLVVLKQYERLDEINQNPAEAVPELKFVQSNTRKWWAGVNAWPMKYEEKKELLTDIHAMGGNIVSGTDVGNPYTIAGFSLHDEFELMHEAGLSPYEVLLTTTVNPAKMLGLETQSGTIEIGKTADVVLLEKNPLEDITNTRTVTGVVANGIWLSGEELQGMLNKLEKKLNP